MIKKVTRTKLEQIDGAGVPGENLVVDSVGVVSLEQKLEQKVGNVVSYRANGSKRVQFFTGKVSRTSPEFVDEVNINTIVKRYTAAGFDPMKAGSPYIFVDGVLDTSQYGDFQENLNRVVAGREAFDALPSFVRKRFSNDPGEFLKFASDPNNGAEMVRLGLAELRPAKPDSVAKADDSDKESSKKA